LLREGQLDRTTTTTDSLGIVSLATAAFKRGQLSEAQLQAINGCADDFTQVLIVANRYRELTGEPLALDSIPSPAELRRYVEAGEFGKALKEAAGIKARMAALFRAAKERLSHLGLRSDGMPG
jgi:hypothetical protein